MVSNSLKHAFRINQVGNIEIIVKKDNSNIMLYINDNGVGLPSDFDIATNESLGLQLVTTLVIQLDGTINIDSSGTGTEIVIIFPELKYKDRV